jgi:PncC family amidohydrolase
MSSPPLTDENIESSFISTRKYGDLFKLTDMKPAYFQQLELFLKEVENTSIKYGIKLINTLEQLNNKHLIKPANSTDIYVNHKIATAESLTSGLIMSTLVDIPYGGYLKYGGFMVYDTDAKRTFIGVTENNVYTKKCSIQMAKGILLNSNATIAIAVTGHAMPTPSDTEHIGKVDICIAGFDENNNIIFSTSHLDSCASSSIISKACKKWKYVYTKKNASDPQRFVSSKYTALISKIIRYITVIESYKQCISFIEKYNPHIPKGNVDLKKRLLNNLTLRPELLPKSKYFDSLHLKPYRAVVKTSKQKSKKNNVGLNLNDVPPLLEPVTQPVKPQKSSLKRTNVKGINI